MRKLNLKSSNKKKVRGLKRKTKNMVKDMMEMVDFFPEQDEGRGYWYMHLPVAQDFIDSKKTPKSVRRFCIQTLIDATDKLIKIKPEKSKTRVVASISLPELWNSQIIIFFEDDYFNSFFDRNTDCQKWTLLKNGRSLKKEKSLIFSNNLLERGYLEEIHDENYDYKGELWFVGELN